jgi:CheY-like chemotaxis protein
MSKDGLPADSKLALVVDDYPEMRSCIRAVLEYAGYQVADAQNGTEALRILQSLKEPPAFIVSDVLMDGMNGFQLLEAIRSKHTWRDVPFIFTSGAIDQLDAIDAAIEPGKVSFLAKPFRVDELLDAVRSFKRQYAAATTTSL